MNLFPVNFTYYIREKLNKESETLTIDIIKDISENKKYF